MVLWKGELTHAQCIRAERVGIQDRKSEVAGMLGSWDALELLEWDESLKTMKQQIMELSMLTEGDESVKAAGISRAYSIQSIPEAS